MSIEKSPTPTANTKAAARTDSSHGAKAKASAADAAGDASGTGFMAILGALGDASTDTTVTTASDSALPTVAADASTLAAAPAFDASLLLQQNPQIAAAQAASAAAAAIAAAAAKAANASPAGVADSSGVAGLAGAVGTTGATGLATALSAKFAQDDKTLPLATAAAWAPASALAQPAADAQPEAGLADTAPGLPITTPVRATLGDGLADKALKQAASATAGAATDTAELAPSLTQSLQHAGARARQARDALQSDAGGSAAATGTAAAASERADHGRVLAALEQAWAPQADKVLEPLFAPLLAKQEKPQGERGGFSFKNAEPTYSGSTLGVSAPDLSQSGAPAPVMAPEMQVAEQVSYWVSQNVQNAELTLDGLGQTPVEVSISVQGNEAQITFRSDEAATRSMLESAGNHLKDMLQREGLVLTGVSVGHSGSGEAGGGERRSRQNVRQGVITPLKVASPESGPRLRTDAGRSVDLFV